ncbi:tyrosine-type recombinase/integrase (plasmid) [Pseudomonas oryzihabitans]|nr:tyrosine-type recombinase/integrase [Pseudomonas oryzihabitans]
MWRVIVGQLLPRQVKELCEPGVYQDGRGLILRVAKTGAKRWIFRFSFQGQRYDVGLGGYPAVSLKQARLEADRRRLKIAKGVPELPGRRSPAAPSPAAGQDLFATLARQYIATHGASWSHDHHRQWASSMERYVFPVLGRRPVAKIDTDLVLQVLSPIWDKINVSAARIRNRIESVLDAAQALGYREGANPARWHGHLDKLLPRHDRNVVHHPAAAAESCPSVLHRLDSLEGSAARAAELLILTSLRNAEVREARWCEFDFPAMRWTIPAERMKCEREHIVPLTERMLEVLDQQKGQHDTWVFPNARGKKPLPGNAIGRALRKIKLEGAVPHGFRSTFRTWAAETTSHPREICEKVLAHRIGSKTEAAYNRGQLLEKRRKLMSDWETFLAMPDLPTSQAVTPGRLQDA